MLTEADVNAVKAQIGKYVEAARAGDWDAWADTLAPDAFLSPASVPPMHSREVCLAWAKGFHQVVGLTVDIAEIAGEGNFAYARGTYTFEVALPDGSRTKERGAFLEIHRRLADGSWPYTHLMHHSIEAAATVAAY